MARLVGKVSIRMGTRTWIGIEPNAEGILPALRFGLPPPIHGDWGYEDVAIELQKVLISVERAANIIRGIFKLL